MRRITDSTFCDVATRSATPASTKRKRAEAQIKTNVNKSELGNLGLTDAEELAIVKFMHSLSDGFEPPKGTKRLAPGLR
jgi:hypothetical protein